MYVGSGHVSDLGPHGSVILSVAQSTAAIVAGSPGHKDGVDRGVDSRRCRLRRLRWGGERRGFSEEWHTAVIICLSHWPALKKSRVWGWDVISCLVTESVILTVTLRVANGWKTPSQEKMSFSLMKIRGREGHDVRVESDCFEETDIWCKDKL